MSDWKSKLHALTRPVEPVLWRTELKNAVRCLACGHRCLIYEGRDGICKVRSNHEGQLRVPWGYVGGLQADPIEKKPFFHALPGAKALSFGMLGCDFHCAYCQNWITSQVGRDEESMARAEPMTAQDLVSLAQRAGAEVITSTYNEPLITSEWAVEVFKLARAAGLKTSYVSNGNGTEEVLAFLRPYVDFYKIDLKSFQDKHYRKLGGVLARVTDTIKRVHELGFWLEIVTLIIPGFNDDPGELKALCEFLVSISPDIPWHATAFHPDYKMMEPEPTAVATLYRAAEIAAGAGLNYIYLGNAPGRVGEWEDTRCPGCQKTLVRRYGFKVLDNVIDADGQCPKCHKKIPGRWA